MEITGRCGRSTITRRLNQADAERQIKLPYQIGEKHQATGQNTHKRHRFVLVVPANFPSQVGDPLLNALGRDQNLHEAQASAWWFYRERGIESDASVRGKSILQKTGSL